MCFSCIAECFFSSQYWWFCHVISHHAELDHIHDPIPKLTYQWPIFQYRKWLLWTPYIGFHIGWTILIANCVHWSVPHSPPWSLLGWSSLALDFSLNTVHTYPTGIQTEKQDTLIANCLQLSVTLSQSWSPYCLVGWSQVPPILTPTQLYNWHHSYLVTLLLQQGGLFSSQRATATWHAS